MASTRADWPQTIFVLIPAYKAASELAQFLPKLLEIVPPANVLIGDDGSKDETDQHCRNLGIACFSFPVNRGKGAVLNHGFQLLLVKGARWILTMDADGQHSVDDLRLFVTAAREHPDAGLVIGARRMLPGSMPLARICSNRLTAGLISLITGARIRDCQSGFRLYSAELLKQISLEYTRFEMETEVILKACHHRFPIHFVAVQTLYCSSQSHISHLKDTLRWISAVIRVQLDFYRKRGR
jgi:glycosyltransferase involved in cell wall biosynthesis